MAAGGLRAETAADDEIRRVMETPGLRAAAQSMAQAQGYNGVFSEFVALR